MCIGTIMYTKGSSVSTRDLKLYVKITCYRKGSLALRGDQ